MVFQATGVELITAAYAGCESGKYQLMNQADYFYFSGHGSHATGVLQGGFSAAAVIGYWDKDLECVIISGCSVLDINDYNNNYDGEAHTRSPGKEWEGTGPAVLLGYNYYAPNDLQNSDSIIANWCTYRTTLSDMNAWNEANDNSNGRNACVIVPGIEYGYFHKTPTWIPFVNDYVWTEIEYTDW